MLLCCAPLTIVYFSACQKSSLSAFPPVCWWPWLTCFHRLLERERVPVLSLQDWCKISERPVEKHILHFEQAVYSELGWCFCDFCLGKTTQLIPSFFLFINSSQCWSLTPEKKQKKTNTRMHCLSLLPQARSDLWVHPEKIPLSMPAACILYPPYWEYREVALAQEEGRTPARG